MEKEPRPSSFLQEELVTGTQRRGEERGAEEGQEAG